MKKLFATALVLLAASVLLFGCVQQQAPAPTITPPQATETPQQTVVPTVMPTAVELPPLPSATEEATIAPVAGNIGCSDGTPLNTCSSRKPFFCFALGFQLTALCSECGCPEGKTCTAANYCN